MRIHINLNPKLFGKLIAQKLHLKDASLNLSLLEVGDDEFQLLVENWDNVSFTASKWKMCKWLIASKWTFQLWKWVTKLIILKGFFHCYKQKCAQLLKLIKAYLRVRLETLIRLIFPYCFSIWSQRGDLDQKLPISAIW